MNAYEFSKHNLNKYRYHLQNDSYSEKVLQKIQLKYNLYLYNTINTEYEIIFLNKYKPLHIRSIISLREAIKKDIKKNNSTIVSLEHTQYLIDKILHHTIELLIKEKTLRVSPKHMRTLFKII